MNEQEQRIAIATACGWHFVWTWHMQNVLLKPPIYIAEPNEVANKDDAPLPQASIDELPDYLNDLNAMHEAEKTLSHEECLQFHDHLEYVHARDTERDQPVSCAADDFWFHATAAQRAQAFLKTKGLL